MASHGSDTPTSPRAVLHHTDAILCTFMHTTVTGMHILRKDLWLVIPLIRTVPTNPHFSSQIPYFDIKIVDQKK